MGSEEYYDSASTQVKLYSKTMTKKSIASLGIISLS